MDLSRSMREAKLRPLAEAEGFSSIDELLAAASTDSVCPAICTAPDCRVPHARWNQTRIADGVKRAVRTPCKAHSSWRD